MAWVRKRRRKGGVFFYVVSKDGTTRAAGRDIRLARRWAAKLTNIEAERRAGFDVSGPSWTLGKLRDSDRNKSRHRLSKWAVLVGYFGESFLLDGLPGQPLWSFVETRLRTVSPQTLSNDLSLLRGALTRAKNLGGYHGEIQTIKLPKRRRVRPTTPLTEEQVDALIAAARSLPRGSQSTLVLEVAYLTGARISSVLSMRWDQIRAGAWIVPPAKGGKEVWWSLEDGLGSLLGAVPRVSEWVFPGPSGHRKSIRKFLLAAAKKAGLPPIRPHDLRHSHATNRLYAGDSPAEVSGRLGHVNTQMVSRVYGHIMPRVYKTGPRRGHVKAGETAKLEAEKGRYGESDTADSEGI